MIRSLIAPAFALCCLFFTTSDSTAQNTTEITLDNSSLMDGLSLESAGVDDQLICTLNNREVISGKFGLSYLKWNIFRARTSGVHTVNCKVIDDNGGACYAYKLRLTNGFEILKTLEKSCCTSECSHTNPVLDETFIINVP